MKRIKISFSTLDERGLSDAQEIEGPKVQPDFSRLEAHYKKIKPSLLKYVEQVQHYWQEEGEQRLFEPKARVLMMSRDEAKKECALFDMGEKIKRVASLTWTIGDALEVESIEWMQKRESLNGLLLDVTGSLCLYAMHSALVEWVGSRALAITGFPVVDELYPSLETCCSDTIKKMQECMQTERHIGVRLHNEAMLYPKKSQCAFIMIGEGESLTRKKYARCKPCLMVRCLYWQLGGCHADVSA